MAMAMATTEDDGKNKSVTYGYIHEGGTIFRIFDTSPDITHPPPVNVFNTIKWRSSYNSPSVLAIELALTEWKRRADINEIPPNPYFTQHWAKFASNYIGWKDQATLTIWCVHFDNKHKIAGNPTTRTRLLIVPDKNFVKSMNFADIFHDLNKSFGYNIMYPEGGKANEKDLLSTFTEPIYVSLELILSEWLTSTRQKDNTLITKQMLLIVAEQAAKCIGFDEFHDPEKFIIWFLNKYRMTHGPHKLPENIEETIHRAIKELCKCFGTDIIYPKGRTVTNVSPQPPAKKRKTNPNFDAILDSPPYISLELLMREYVKRAEHNRVYFNIKRAVEQYSSLLGIASTDDNYTEWFKSFQRKYRIGLRPKVKGSLSEPPNEPKSMIFEDIVQDLRQEYGVSAIVCPPGSAYYQPQIIEFPAQWYDALMLIVDEWVSRCRHNRFMITTYNLTELVQSIAGYLQCRSDALVKRWTNLVKQKYFADTTNTPDVLCPLGHKYQLTNVYIIIKDLCRRYGKSRILPFWDHSSKFNVPVKACLLELETDQDDGPSGEPSGSVSTPLFFETEELIIKSEDEECSEFEDNLDSVSEARKAFSANNNDLTVDCDTSTSTSSEIPANTTPTVDGPVRENVSDGNARSHEKPISSYQDAVEYMKCLQNFFIEKEDTRAVGLLNQLEGVIKSRITVERRLSELIHSGAVRLAERSNN